MTDLSWSEIPVLRRPLLLVAFEGAFDAAQAATSALKWICDHAEASEIGEIDPEHYFNFQDVRPLVRIASDGNRVIDWPKTTVHAARTSSMRDLVVMTGIEPHLRWGSFADQVVEVARRSGCEMVVTVGAFNAMVPHTRPFAVTASAVHSELVRRLSLSRPTYEGPTGLVGVISERVEKANIPAISLRVSVPHYVPGPPNPKATRALLRRLQQTTGVSTDYEELDKDVSDWSTRVDAAVASDDESRAYVAHLERQVDSREELLPSGDDLAAELEAFLRDQRPGDALPGDELPGDELPGDELPGDEPSAVDEPPGETSTGDAPTGEPPTGETPAGESPTGETPPEG